MKKKIIGFLLLSLTSSTVILSSCNYNSSSEPNNIIKKDNNQDSQNDLLKESKEENKVKISSLSFISEKQKDETIKLIINSNSPDQINKIVSLISNLNDIKKQKIDLIFSSMSYLDLNEKNDFKNKIISIEKNSDIDNIFLNAKSLNDKKQNKSNEKLESDSSDFKNEYQKLEKEVISFSKNELKELKFEIQRDLLNNVLNETTYNLATKQYNSEDTLFLDQKNKLEKVFKEVKNNYKKTQDITINENDLEIKQGIKQEEIFSNDFFKNENKNNFINEEAKYFISLVKLDDIKDYYHHPNQQNSKDKIKEFTKKIIGNETKTIKKIRLIYDWIHKNLKYAANGTTTAAIDPVKAIEIKTAVCGGYSNLYKAMLDSINVKNVTVIGWSKYGAHQWNLVFDEEKNEFFHSDPTWGGEENFRPTIKKFSDYHITTKIESSGAQITVDNVMYEYNRGFSVYKFMSNDAKHKEVFTEKNNKITGISQDALKTIKNLYVGEFIERIDYQGGTHDVEKFEVSPKNKKFASKDGVLYTKDLKTLLVVPKKYKNKEFVLPKETKTIEDWKSSLNSDNLEKVNVEPGNYWYASYGGILYNNNLTSIIYVPKKIHPVVTIYSKIIPKENNFSFNDNISEIIIPEGIKEIPAGFLNYLPNLKLVQLPSTLESIDINAFRDIDRNKFKIKLANQTNNNVIKFLEDNKYNIEK
ncbi:transglutaminase domain-containing protein [Metamycoplasma canadense]|uniref:Surface protein n=1 Tax=Metamycoplasma canadense TaxID=29554 RepID=A0A077L6X7_9BACT|nr:transglutaminase domain-containing protein [Metamycoplasma canadense]BAP39777.1 surface protein [Metamycoplasma canadense]